MTYQKHFTPIESNPDLFTKLIHHLGVSSALSFHDVWSLDEDELLSLIPRPVLAFIVVFPTSSDYESKLAQENNLQRPDSNPQNVIWFKQTINNACGLYGILHAVANGRAREYIEPGSHISRLLESCSSLKPSEYAGILENDSELESKYHSVALLGDTEAPENPEDEVDFHYVCFVKSHGDLYVLDGDRNWPISKGALPGDDLLSEQGVLAIKEFISGHDNGGGFSLLALSPTSNFG
ncbi:ubiquitin carboxyl-terminal hydrolase, family 1 [Xylariaceae sp. FL0255]|nr:ubiquitin carboxyl-terminal hydrolase, family 1 [Xylariaceae sp. FL0255]